MAAMNKRECFIHFYSQKDRSRLITSSKQTLNHALNYVWDSIVFVAILVHVLTDTAIFPRTFSGILLPLA